MTIGKLIKYQEFFVCEELDCKSLEMHEG